LMSFAEKVDYHGITTNLPQKSGFSAHPACALRCGWGI